jgi:hypothetical protein
LGTILPSAVSGIWRFCKITYSLLSAYIYGDNAWSLGACFADSLKDHAACKDVSSVIMFLIRECWHPERMCRTLSTCGQRGIDRAAWMDTFFFGLWSKFEGGDTSLSLLKWKSLHWKSPACIEESLLESKLLNDSKKCQPC